MFRTTLTVLFAALTLSVPAFAQKGATGQDATQTKPLAELKETESTYEEVPVVIGTGSTKTPAEEPVVVVQDRRAPAPTKVIAEPIEYPQYEEPAKEQAAAYPQLRIGLVEGILGAEIEHEQDTFFGGVLLSLSDQTVDLGWLGYSILQDAVVMGIGFGAEGRLGLQVPASKDLAGLEFFAQAALLDNNGIRVGYVERAVAQ